MVSRSLEANSFYSELRSLFLFTDGGGDWFLGMVGVGRANGVMIERAGRLDERTAEWVSRIGGQCYGRGGDHGDEEGGGCA